MHHTRRQLIRLVGIGSTLGIAAVGTASARGRPETYEERTGTILTVSDDQTSGTLRDSGTGDDREFKNPALVDVQVDDDVVFVHIEAANGTAVDIIQDKN